jgi:hypothetical protein
MIILKRFLGGGKVTGNARDGNLIPEGGKCWD